MSLRYESVIHGSKAQDEKGDPSEVDLHEFSSYNGNP